jgi:iron complex transport system substrate-binding protein
VVRGAAALLLLMLAACAPAPAPQGTRPHPTIVSLNLCADEILAEVAAPGQLLAVSHYSHDPRVSSMPARMRRFPATGGTVEEIVALQPDLVIGDPFTPPATRGALARLKVRFAEVPIALDVATSTAQIRALAGLAGQPARGEALIARMGLGLAAARPPPGSARPAALVWQGGGLVAGDTSLIAQLLARTGFRPSAAARGLGQGAVLPLEAMLADPPQAILVAGSRGAEDNRGLHHPALDRLSGVTRAELDLRLIYCGGPTIPRTAARLKQIREAL